MKRKLKIAFIGARGVAGTYSGIETYYEEIGSRLAAMGHEVTAYCRNHFTPPMETYRGVRVRRLPALRSKHLETLTHSVLCTLDSLRHDFDIVQYHAIGSAPLAVIPRMLGRRTVVSVRGLDWQRAKWGRFARNALKFGEWASARSPSATIVVSQSLLDHYREHHGARTVCIPNAVVPVVRVAPDRIRQLGLEPDKYILYAGRISPEKNVHVILEALKPFAGRIKLAIAGGSSYSDEYVDRVRSMAWDDVVFLGSVDRSMMQELFSSCYAYVLPSVMEGLSISLLEAISYGCCIVVTDIPENLEVVGDVGLTFSPGDVERLRAHFTKILDEPNVVLEQRARAAARAAAQPDWDEVARLTEGFYFDLLGVDSAMLDASKGRRAERHTA